MDLSAYTIRTDLALEAHDMASNSGQAIPGVHMSSETHDGITVSTTDITSQEGSAALGKLPGHYITIEVPQLRKRTVCSRIVLQPSLPKSSNPLWLSSRSIRCQRY